MARWRETGAPHQDSDFSPQQRNFAWIGVVRRGGVEADHAALADHIAFVVEALHADVIEIARAMHRGA